MTGMLAEMGHGAGIWISPVNVPGLELMVPWQFVKSVITAVLGVPFNLAWLIAWILLSTLCMWAAYRVEAAREKKDGEIQ